MIAPEQDITDRKPVWDVMQMIWMDIDPNYEIESIALVCAKSKYSIDELRAIFWNEVYPAVRSNLWIPVAPEWAGYDLDFLVTHILKKNRFGKKLLMSRFRAYSYDYWGKIKLAILVKRRKLSLGAL